MIAGRPGRKIPVFRKPIALAAVNLEVHVVHGDVGDDRAVGVQQVDGIQAFAQPDLEGSRMSSAACSKMASAASAPC